MCNVFSESDFDPENLTAQGIASQAFAGSMIAPGIGFIGNIMKIRAEREALEVRNKAIRDQLVEDSIEQVRAETKRDQAVAREYAREYAAMQEQTADALAMQNLSAAESYTVGGSVAEAQSETLLEATRYETALLDERDQYFEQQRMTREGYFKQIDRQIANLPTNAPGYGSAFAGLAGATGTNYFGAKLRGMQAAMGGLA